MTDKDQERSSGGSAMLRHESRGEEWTAADCDVERAAECVEAHMEKCFGPTQSVYHEVISDLVHLDVHTVALTNERPFYILFTTGMSDLPMTLPEHIADDPEYACRAELLIGLPPD